MSNENYLKYTPISMIEGYPERLQILYIPRIPIGDEGDFIPKDEMTSDNCHDCGNKIGEYHEYGCDCERCPRCGMQLISCSCNDKYDIEPLNKAVRLFSRSNCV